jgi:hypothetical protein
MRAAVPAATAFEGADPSFAAGAPFDVSAEGSSVFLGMADMAWSASARDDDVANPKLVQRVIDARLAVAVIGGHGACVRPGWCLMRPIAGASCGGSGLPLLDGVIEGRCRCPRSAPCRPNSTGLPRRPSALGRLRGSSGLTGRIASHGITARCRGCAAI